LSKVTVWAAGVSVDLLAGVARAGTATPVSASSTAPTTARALKLFIPITSG
jgi:hypothetical protein